MRGENTKYTHSFLNNQWENHQETEEGIRHSQKIGGRDGGISLIFVPHVNIRVWNLIANLNSQAIVHQHFASMKGLATKSLVEGYAFAEEFCKELRSDGCCQDWCKLTRILFSLWPGHIGAGVKKLLCTLQQITIIKLHTWNRSNSKCFFFSTQSLTFFTRICWITSLLSNNYNLIRLKRCSFLLSLPLEYHHSCTNLAKTVLKEI